MKPDGILGQLALQFAILSLIAIGGANTVVPEMHRMMVESNSWMSDATFADLYAIAQAAPGPNIVVATLLGWYVAGLAGALVTTAAICVPSSLLAYAVSGIWHRFRGAPWRAAVQNGMAPVTIGLVLATAYILARAADHGWTTAAVTAAAAGATLATKLNPLWVLGAAGALGALGVVT
jgi:chromate transporter